MEGESPGRKARHRPPRVSTRPRNGPYEQSGGQPLSVPEAATAEYTSQTRRAVAVVVAVVFIDLVGFGIVIPILPFYVRSFGVSDVYIGVLAATYSLAQFLAAPVLGRISDERGRRPVILLSLAGSAVAWAVFGVAGEVGGVAGVTVGLLTLFFARLLAGAMGGNLAAANAYVADVTPVDRRAGALGLLGAAFSVGFIFGPAIGGVVASDAVVEAARGVLPGFVPATQYSLPSFAAAGASLVALGFALVFLAEPERTRSVRERETVVSQFREALADPNLRGFAVAFFIASVAFAGVQVMFIPFAADVYGYSATETALFLTYIGVVGALNQGVLVGRLSRQFASSTLATAGSVGLVAALALLPFSPDVGRALLPAAGVGGPAWLTPELVVLLFDGALLSVSNGLLSVSLSTLLSTGTSADRQGTAFGVTQGAGSLGRTVGPPLAAALYIFAYWLPFAAGAVVLLGILPVIAAIARRERR